MSAYNQVIGKHRTSVKEADSVMLTKKWLPLIIPCLGLSVSPQLSAHNLQEAVAHALQTGPDMLISVNNRYAVDEELRQAFSGYLPTLEMTAGWGREQSENATTRGALNNGGRDTLWRTEFGLTARQMLFDGFAVKSDVEGKMARVRAATWRANNDAQETALQVVSAFLDVNLRKKLVAVAQENLAAHQRVFAQIEKRSEGGIGRRADLDQAEGRLAFARTNFMAEQANLRDAETRYLRLVGIPPISLTQPENPTANFPETLRSAIAVGINNHPELRAAVSDVTVAKAANRAAKASYLPRLDFEAGLSRNHNLDGSKGGNDDFTAMLRMRWNLFKGGADVARVKETAWKTEEAKEVRNRAHRQVEESVRLAWSNFTTAKGQLGFFKQHMHASERTRDAYQKQFNIGQRTLLDLLDSENELFASTTAYINGKHTELLGRFRVLNATGNILNYLAIPLPKAAQYTPPTMFGRDYVTPEE
jgi:adhesin transport system outer membrane protein